MSLHPQTTYCVSEETARVAHAAFPKGNLYLRIADELGVIYTDQQFADLFPRRGQPALSPVRLALATILQFAEGLSDRQTADAVRGRIDWKYLLCLDLTDAGFDHSVLSEFRTRVRAGNPETLLLDTLLTQLQERGLLEARGKQRTDSTRVLAAVRMLNRLERVGETLRAALNAVATVVPAWVQSWIPADWIERYGPRVDNYRFPKAESTRTTVANQIGTDGALLLAQIDTAAEPWLAEIPAVKTLRAVWADHYTTSPEHIRWQTVAEMPSAADQIVSPYDPDGRWSMKRDKTWIGYKVHITETCDDQQPRLITHVATTVATTPDDQIVPTIHAALAEKQVLPSIHFVDAGYTDATLLLHSQQQYGIDLYGPVAADPSWQARQQTGYDHTAFQLDWETKTATCPQGIQSTQWHQKHDIGGIDCIDIRFPVAVCRHCPSRTQCTKGITAPRHLKLRSQPLYLVMQAARDRQASPTFKALYAHRAGIESTMAQGIRRSHLQHARYRGLARVAFQQIVTAVALNLIRISAWWAGVPIGLTRVSAFQSLRVGVSSA